MSKDSRTVQSSIRESRRIFLECIWPMWAADLAAANIVSTEDSEEALEREADRSGTDAFFVRHKTGILVPVASRIEFFDQDRNNPFSERYWSHYPRFTIRLAIALKNGELETNVECKKRLLALEDPISRRYLPLFTFQSIVRRQGSGFEVLQCSRVRTDRLFEYVRDKGLFNIQQGAASRTKAEKDVYRIVTVEKLRIAGIDVVTKDCRSL